MSASNIDPIAMPSTTQANTLKEEFSEKGYVILRDFFSKSQMDSLIEDIKTAKTRNGVSGLNKGALTFYSSLFFHNPSIREFVSQPKLVDLLKQIIGPDFWVRWDQAVAKGPGAGTFGWHQDNGYSRLHEAYYQLWIALTDMTPENGGLWLEPGSHKYLLPHKSVDKHRVYEGAPENPVFIEAKAGDVVVFSSFTLHSTTPNITQQTRWAYVVEYMSTDQFDPSIEPPYFMVARVGKPQPEFVHFYRGRLNPLNQLKYLGFRWGIHWSSLRFLPGRLAKFFANTRSKGGH
ncbi:MAG: phytanoyl-CoA dioxygenase family protein [Methylococcaceae bacterium]|nr:phytanoyl-CoA dioxygenase family protein [Methylococcaceae bacterium]